MIIFLTLCYVAALAILVKLGLVKLSLWWKLSPLVWMLLLLLVLFLPMQWGAPAGEMKVLNYVVEIIPNVSGEVTEVQASGLVPSLNTSSAAEQHFAVILNIDDERIDANSLRGGAVGTVAIYTDDARMTHVIRRVMVRMQTWMNYILP